MLGLNLRLGGFDALQSSTVVWPHYSRSEFPGAHYVQQMCFQAMQKDWALARGAILDIPRQTKSICAEALRNKDRLNS